MNSESVFSGTKFGLPVMMLLSFLVFGCATAAKDVRAVYVSPLEFLPYDCEQLSIEARRVGNRIQQLGGRLDQASTSDQSITGLGLVVFWPALFALGGTAQQESEFAHLKGTYQAINLAADEKKCTANPLMNKY